MAEKKQSSEDIKLESVSSQNFEPEDERKLVRKLDGRIVVILSILYLFAYLDRSNLGNARLLGLPKDTLNGDPTGKRFDWVNSVFFFAYVFISWPCTVDSTTLGWGLSSTLMATAFDFGSLMTGRVFLGIFEAGFGPVIPLYFSFFYTKEEIGVRMAYWFGFAAVAGAFGGLISFGVQHVHAAIHNWSILFIIERIIALDRMNRGTSGDTGPKVDKAHILMAFRDWRCYTGGVVYFGLNCALASISAFLPTIIATFGFIAAILLLSFSWASDRLQSRGIFMTIACTISGIGYVLLLAITNTHVRYFAVFCIVSGTYATIGYIVSCIIAHNLGSETKRATGIPIFMATGQCGSVLGSHIFPLTEGPRYLLFRAHERLSFRLIYKVSCALAFLSAVLSLVLSISYRRDNARRDKLYGKPDTRGRVDTAQLADKANDFRYVI
ncbi:MFS general substrate transporter [Mycena olivaceomarginata]|nr:MFS general substrate transporter [Mycena olivaceomarginata]